MVRLQKYGVADSIYTVLRTAGSTVIKANPTLAAGDVKISKDGGAFANLATLPDAYPAAGSQVRIQLAVAELQCKYATIIFHDQTATAEWDDNAVEIQTYGNASASLVFDLSQATPAVNVTQIDAQTTVGNNATLNLKQLNIVNNAGSAIIASATGGNGNGIAASGNGTGHGLSSTGGATGNGVLTTGGATSGDGLKAIAGASGRGVYAVGTANLSGIRADGQGTAPGVLINGGATGIGLSCVGGATSGAGISATATSGDGITATGGTAGHGVNATGAGAGNGVLATGGNSTTTGGIKAVGGAATASGIYAVGNTTGAGLKATGGATGIGFQIIGGGTSGVGLSITTTSGDGVSVTPTAGFGVRIIGSGQAGLRVESDTAAGVVFAGGTNSTGFTAIGNGSGPGATIEGGTTGDGLFLFSGGSSGSGLAIWGQNGNGVTITTSATNAHGIAATGAGTGSGARLVGGATGHGLTLLGSASGNDLNAETPSSNLPVEATVSGTVDANLVSIDGELTNENSATLYLKKLDIQNVDDSAINIVTTGSYAHSVFVKASETGGGDAVHFEGGNGAHGLAINGDVGCAIEGLVGNGLLLIGAGSDNGLNVMGGETGAGAVFMGGATSGSGVIMRGGTLGKGLEIYGAGNQPGLYVFCEQGDGAVFQATDAGQGILAIGAGSGSGMKAVGGTSDGHGFYAVGGAGSDGHGAEFERGSGGGGDDLHFATPDCTIPVTSLVTELDTQAKADVRAEVDDALEAIDLDHLSKIADAPLPTIGSNLDLIMNADGGQTFDRSTDSLEAISDAVGGISGITQQEVRDAMKLAPSGGAPAVGSVDDSLDILEASTASIEAQTDLLSFTGSDVNANVDEIDTNRNAAIKLAASADTEEICTVDSTNFVPTTTEFETATAISAKDRWVIFRPDSTLAGEAKPITACAIAGGKYHITCEALTAAPINGDGFVIV